MDELVSSDERAMRAPSMDCYCQLKVRNAVALDQHDALLTPWAVRGLRPPGQPGGSSNACAPARYVARPPEALAPGGDSSSAGAPASARPAAVSAKARARPR